jgi:hypothetical protein
VNVRALTARKACPVPCADTASSMRLKADSPLATTPCSAEMATLVGWVDGRVDGWFSTGG